MLYLLRKVAKHPLVSLVDKPNTRKFHEGAVPLVGGISICLSILYFLYNNANAFPFANLYSFCIIVLVGVGVLDDKYDISVKFRMGVQAALAVVIMYYADAQITDLGNMLGFGELILPDLLGQIITVFAVLGAINAFNMVDGIDGLLGGLASVTFASLATLFFMQSKPSFAYFCVVIIVVILPYILFNLGFFGRTRKVFMGDAGSMLIGFTVVLLLMGATQQGKNGESLRTVTALWIIAVPLMDMAAIMYRRIKRGDSPFKPDREHLHHIFQRIGFNSTQTLLAICSLALFFASIGVLGEIFEVPEPIMFYLFIAFFIGYSVVLSNIWKIMKRIRSMQRLSRAKRVGRSKNA